MLFSLNRASIILGIAVLGLIGSYPFMKRVTYWPQVFLGLNFNWGALVGWTAVAGTLGRPALLLYLGGIFWTIGYDTIYAHQDKEDDALIGVKSSALALGSAHPPVALRLLCRCRAAVGHGRLGGRARRMVLGRARRRDGAASLAGGARRYRPPGRLPCQIPLEPRARLADARRDRCRSRDLSSPLDPALFVRRNTAVAAPPLVPEIRLHLATEVTPIWQATRRKPGARRRAAAVLGIRLGRWPGTRPLPARSSRDGSRALCTRFRLRFGAGRDRRGQSRRPLCVRRRDRPFRRGRHRRQRCAERCRGGGNDRGCDRRRRPPLAGRYCRRCLLRARYGGSRHTVAAGAGGGWLSRAARRPRARLSAERRACVQLASYTVPTSRELEDSETRDGVVWQVLPP